MGKFQFPVSSGKLTVIKFSKPISIKETSEEIFCSGTNHCMKFSKTNGRFQEFSVTGEKNIIVYPLALNLYRPVIDNHQVYAEQIWQKYHLHLIQEHFQSIRASRLSPGLISIVVETCLAPPAYNFGYDCRYEYKLYGTGRMEVTLSGKKYGLWEHAFLPKIGCDMKLISGFQDLEWYGRGPQESYIDSRSAALISLYRSRLADLETPYIYPQEYGNLSDVRFARLSSESQTLSITANSEPFHLSAWNYSADDIYSAQHRCELRPAPYVTLNIDHRLSGLGSKSFGQDILEEHRVGFADFCYSFVMDLERK
ncbi:MAG: hypothetical protein AAF975_05145 [Spirochaetota bacterium]